MRFTLALQPLPEKPTDPEPDVIELEKDWEALPRHGDHIMHGDTPYVVLATWWDEDGSVEVMAKALQ